VNANKLEKQLMGRGYSATTKCENFASDSVHLAELCRDLLQNLSNQTKPSSYLIAELKLVAPRVINHMSRFKVRDVQAGIYYLLINNKTLISDTNSLANDAGRALAYNDFARLISNFMAKYVLAFNNFTNLEKFIHWCMNKDGGF